MVDGTSYSFGRTGLDVRSREDYLRRNSFRTGYSMVLNLTPEEEERFVASMMEFEGESYNFLLRNCADLPEQALESLGYQLGPNVSPTRIMGSADGLRPSQEE